MAQHKTLTDFAADGTMITAPDGACLFRPDDPVSAFLIVVAGTVRVEHSTPAGRTVTLYRVEVGDSCVLTTTCLLSARAYSGFGYAEGPVRAIAIPADRFRHLLGTDPAFQEVVFRGFAQRVGELTDVIDTLLVHRTDLRIAHWLGTRSAQDLNMTHEDIAQELGTAREVVSRTLKALERNGWIETARGHVRIIDQAALCHHARAHTV
ncbi:Crp/Fnr family transcriptional regulator [uncultured Tateyamaria sp.]|uniref:Crp/Fnr family transcriptional regulator n=1 Tax=uncultured Tateyamaria sp. TaxID=455651 RepID=UPI00260A233E|nr:Crp/Fnr family transcriptional regulator [uncultured Tateyamaria sp.]